MANARFGDVEGAGERHDADAAPAHTVADGRDSAAAAGNARDESGDDHHDHDHDDDDRLWRPSTARAETTPALESDDISDDDPDRSWRPSTSPATVASASEPGGARSDRPARPERIVLTDETPTSAWARPRDGSPAAAPVSESPPGAAVEPDDRSTATVVTRPPNVADNPVDDPGDLDDLEPANGAGGVRRRRGLVTVVGTLLAVLAVLAVVAAVLVRDRADRSEPAAVTAPPLPDGARIAWTTSLDGSIETAATGDGLVAVVSSDGLTVLSAIDGEVVWRRVNAADAGEIEQVAIIDGVVVATQQSAAGTTEVRSFDPATGTELWRTRGRDGTYSISGRVDAPIIVGRRRVDRATELSVLDPTDGTELGAPIRLSGVEAVGGHFASAPTERLVAVWSPDELGVIAGPVDEFNLRTVAELDGAVVALDLEGRIVAFDRDGRRSDELVLIGSAGSGDGGTAIASVDFVGVASGVGVVSGESSLGFSVVDGRIETAWERLGFAGQPTATSIGDLMVLVSRDDAGGVDESIIETATGAVVTTVESAGPRERLSMLAANGYVIAPLVDAAERVVTAIGYDGESLWSLPLSPEADYEVTADGIVMIEPTPAGADVSFAR